VLTFSEKENFSEKLVKVLCLKADFPAFEKHGVYREKFSR